MQADPNFHQDSEKNAQADSEITKTKQPQTNAGSRRLFLGRASRRIFLGRAIIWCG